MVKYTQTIRWLLATTFLSVFDHFWGLAVKGLKILKIFQILHQCGLRSETFEFVLQCPTTRPLLPNLNGLDINKGVKFLNIDSNSISFVDLLKRKKVINQ